MLEKINNFIDLLNDGLNIVNNINNDDEIFKVIYVSLIIVLIILNFILLLILKRLRYRYYFIQYLYHNNGYNRFNSLPKMILLKEKEKIINKVEIERVKIDWELKSEKGEFFSSKIDWTLNDMKNVSRESIGDYVLYNTYDRATSTDVMFFYNDGLGVNREQKIEYVESNRVRRMSIGLPRMLKPKQKMNFLKLTLQSQNSVKKGKTDLICIYPRNYGISVKSIEINILIQSEEELYDLYFYEIGKIRGKKGVSERTLQKGIPVKQEDGLKYYFEFSEDIIQENVYVVLLKERR